MGHVRLEGHSSKGVGSHSILVTTEMKTHLQVRAVTHRASADAVGSKAAEFR